MPDLIDYAAKTFGDHLLEMAVEIGIARYVDDAGDDSEALLPTDPGILGKLKMRWNAGYQKFLRGVDPVQTAAPGKANAALRPYTTWTFLTKPVTITIDPNGTGPDNIQGDSARYRLPDSITSAPNQGWTFDSAGTYAGLRVISTSIQRVVDLLALTSTYGPATGCPQMAATRPISNPDDPDGGKAWEVVVAPRPSIAMTMSAEFRVQARPLTDLNQRHIAGPEHDETIRMFALAEWWRRDDATGRDYPRAMQEASSSLAASIQLDKKSRGNVVGIIRDPGVRSNFVNRGSVVAGFSSGIVIPIAGIPVF